MAQAVRYVCGNCSREIVAWSDGNPYYINEAGRKEYAYHPDHERLARCIGNDLPHLCLSCGEEFNIDSHQTTAECPKCGAADIANTFALGGLCCPYCKAGIFTADPDFHCVS